MFTASAGPAGEIMYMFGGDDSDEKDDMAYLNIATTGNATDMWGRLDSTGNLGYKSLGGAAASASRMVIAGGRSNNPGPAGHRVSLIEYLDYGSGGNTQTFGDLLQPNYFCTATSSGDSLARMVISGGDAGGTVKNIMQYISIPTTGDASDFGDMLSTKQRGAGLSGDAA